jgi:geranylgeranyl diphosphate synthase type I
MELKELLALKKAIEKELQTQLALERKKALKDSPRLVPFLDAARKFTLRGGKRFRAVLLLAGYHIAGGEDLRVALPAAAALETFQSWMLMHDDVIDHSEVRRDGPTMHLEMAKYHTDSNLLGADVEFGEGAAITLGDMMEPVTVRLLLAPKVPEGRKVALLSEYSEMTRQTAIGQMLDIYLSSVPVAKVTEKDVLTIQRLKSAVYSVSSPLRMGAILAGAQKPLLDTLQKSGDALGIAFQLRDDVLGLGLSDVEVVGKSTNDLFEGKRTLLVVHAWRHTDASGRAALEKVLGNPLSSPRSLEIAQDVIRESGALDYSEERIRAFRELGLSRLKGLPKDSRALMEEIGLLLTNRRN